MAFKPEIVVYLAFLMSLVPGLLSVFAPKLAQVKREGSLDYGALVRRYVCEFDKKSLSIKMLALVYMS
jgi:hypothetical protein